MNYAQIKAQLQTAARYVDSEREADAHELVLLCCGAGATREDLRNILGRDRLRALRQWRHAALAHTNTTTEDKP